MRDSSRRFARNNCGKWRTSESNQSAFCSPGEDGGRSQGTQTSHCAYPGRSALYDGLTNLPNRTLFADRLQHALLRTRRHSDYEFAVLLVDTDEFKLFNDSLGRSAGDELPLQVARRLAAGFRDTDTLARPDDLDSSPSRDGLARMAGDEFTVLFEDLANPSDAIRVAERIQSKVAVPFELRGQEIVVRPALVWFPAKSVTRLEMKCFAMWKSQCIGLSNLDGLVASCSIFGNCGRTFAKLLDGLLDSTCWTAVAFIWIKDEGAMKKTGRANAVMLL